MASRDVRFRLLNVKHDGFANLKCKNIIVPVGGNVFRENEHVFEQLILLLLTINGIEKREWAGLQKNNDGRRLKRHLSNDSDLSLCENSLKRFENLK